MATNFKGRSFLTLMDFTTAEIRYLIDLAHDLKSERRSGTFNYTLKGKSIVLLFEKSSTRTRCAFEVAALEEGAHVTFLGKEDSHFGKKESIEDTAKVLGRFYDGIEYRGYAQSIVEDLAKYSGVPVYNGLTNVDHPTQILADIMTIEEHIFKPLNTVKVVFVGDTRNNVMYSWMYGCAKLGMHFVAYGPTELHPDPKIVAKVNKVSKDTGATITISSNKSCLEGADVIYTDVWVSTGEEESQPQKVALLAPYKVTMDMLELTGNTQVKFMHCLPSCHDFETMVAQKSQIKGLDIREVTDEVFRSRHSIVFDEAENRVHSIKAVLVATL